MPEITTARTKMRYQQASTLAKNALCVRKCEGRQSQCKIVLFEAGEAN